MNKERVLSLIRHGMSVVGGLLIAYGVVSATVLATFGGALIALVALVWSFFDQTYTLGGIEGAVRQILTSVAAFFVGSTGLSPEKIEMWVSLATMIAATVLGQTDKLWGDVTPESEKKDEEVK